MIEFKKFLKKFNFFNDKNLEMKKFIIILRVLTPLRKMQFKSHKKKQKKLYLKAS